MAVASILSAITDALTAFISDYGLYAVFLLMLIDAVFPAASELVMVYSGAVAAGAFAGQDVVLFGYTFPEGFPAYVAMALAGTKWSTSISRVCVPAAAATSSSVSSTHLRALT